MKKLWKRLVMLGALVGCMATAAWAGNVEVSIVDHNGGQVQYAEEGYYTTSVYGSEKFEYHFDKNGRVAWKKATEAGQPYIIHYTYDENGNVIKAARSIERSSGGHTSEIDTYTYDDQGRVSTHEQRVSQEYGQSEISYTRDTFTYDQNYVVVESVDNYSIIRRFEFTLDENGRVEKEVKYRGADKDNLAYIAEIVYSYDENGNLEKVQTYMDDIVSNELVYFYNENNKCVRIEDRSMGLSSYTAFVYEYDENGNVTCYSMLDVDDASGKERRINYCDFTYEKLSPVQDDSVFTDVTDKNGFAYDAIIWATETGITKGTTETTFSPRAQCTRAQMVTFLWRAAGSPEPTTTENPFTDVKEGAYYKAILWAVENGITKGTTADKFSPNAQCTRAQIVTFIYRAAGEPEVEDGTNPFTDVKSGAYYDAILWAVENGITNGTTATTFSPSTVCNRGQGVTFLYRGIGLY